MLEQLYVGIPATVVAADGTASIPLDNGWPRSGWAKWNVTFTGKKGVVSVLAGGVPVFGPVPVTNGGVIGGPVLTLASDQISIRLVGGQPGDRISGYIRGGSADTASDLDSIAAITSSTIGSTQSDPSKLITGQVGFPLIENVTAQIPNRNLNPNWVDFYADGNTAALGNTFFGRNFDVGGYSALLLMVDPNTTFNCLVGLFTWYDSDGGQITATQIDALVPAARVIVGVLGQQALFSIGNTDTINHAVNNLSLIPLVSMPAFPDNLLDNGTPQNPGVAFAPSSRTIISALPSVTVGSPITLTGNFVWAGKVKLSIFTNSNTWHAVVACTDASGNVTFISRITNQAGGFVEDLQLTSGLVSVIITNDAASGTITPNVNMVATS